MPTYMLEGGTAVRLAPRPLTIALQLAGPVPGRLVALVDGEPVADAVRPRPELLILPNVTGSVLLRIEPIGAAVFAQGSRANVSVSVNDPGAIDPERAVLPPVDLAGLASQDALSVKRTEDGLRVRGEVREVVQITLGPLADAARVAATELVGTQRLPERSAIDVAIGVDASASFRRRLDDGYVRRAVSLIDGVAAVIDPDRRADARILAPAETYGAGAGGLTVTPTAGATLADAIDEALRGVTPRSGEPLASGERSPLRQLVARDGVAERSITYVLTDAAPADRAALERLHAEGDGARVVHLVVLGRGSAWGLQRPPAVPCTLIDLDALPPAPGDGVAADPLVTAPALLRPLVASLLEGRPA